MDPQLYTLVKIILAVVLGGVIGYEREKHGHYAGIRTHILVCMTSTFLVGALLSSDINFVPDSVARVCSGILTGIGFIGAGTILSHGKEVKGLTTAASVWGVSALGIIIAIGALWEALIVTLVMIVILEMRFFALKTKIL